eukprot:jgi/Ulvmu1/12407/UM009_0056.1
MARLYIARIVGMQAARGREIAGCAASSIGCSGWIWLVILSLVWSPPVCVNAQRKVSADAGVPVIFRLDAGSCARFSIGSATSERQAYYVLADVTSTTGSCNASQVLRSLPQDAEHFGKAEYDNATTCDEVKQPTFRGRFSVQHEVSLDFFPAGSALSQALPYMVCTDTAWRSGDFATQQVGPLQTYVFLDNTCGDGGVAVAVTVVRAANVSAEEYCTQLVEQASGIRTVEIIFTVSAVMVNLVTLLGLFMCTACCSCWCCCARSGRCATDCTRSCHRGCACFVTALGIAWIMDKAGGLTFYNTSQSSPLLFWAFSAACLTTFQVVNLPEFTRGDTLHPERRTTNGNVALGPLDVKDVPAIEFVSSLITSFVYAVAAFGVVPVVFSDAVRDPSFRSKAMLGGVLLVSTNIVAVCVMLDKYRYYDLWPHKAPQVVLQLGLFITHFMATLTFFNFLRRATTQRHALRAKLRVHGPPQANLQAPVDVAVLPYATVAAPPGQAAAALSLSDEHLHAGCSGRRAGPVAEATTAATAWTSRLSRMDISAQPPSHGGSGALELSPPAEVHSTNSRPVFSPRDAAPASVPSLQPAESEEPIHPVHGDARHDSSEQQTWTRWANALADDGDDDAVAGGGGNDAEVAMGEALEEAAPATARSCLAACDAFLRKLWDDVKEEPQVGFRYSVFMSASLLIAAVTTTSSLLRAGSVVIDLSECTLEGSTCLRNVQRWLYERFLQSLVRVEPAALELQADGVCSGVLRGDATALLASGASTDLSHDEVLAACETASGLEALQDEQPHPQWLADARSPVLIGGFAAIIAAYCISMYTIYHVARAYKGLELRLKASRLAEVMWKRKSSRVSLLPAVATASDTDSSAAPSSGRGGTVRKARVQLGRDILKDYETVSIGQSAYFTGTLVSTCFFQLWLGGAVLGAVLIPLLHPSFWRLVGDNLGWVISLAFILAWHILSQLLLNRYVTDGKRILRPFMWLFLYIALSAGYCVVAVLLAAVRLVQLVLTSILALSRLDSCLFTVLRGRDRGYASFLAMALMLHSFQQCLKETAAGNEASAQHGASRGAQHGLPPPDAEAQRRWRAMVARAVVNERTRAAVAGHHDSHEIVSG